MDTGKNGKKTPLVSVIILNYNGLEHLPTCFTSLLKTRYRNIEIIFVDNNSEDGSIKYVREKVKRKFEHKHINFKIVENQRNLGYCRGNNVGLRFVEGKYIIFLNNDTMVDPEWVSELVRVMEPQDDVGIAQCKILYLDNPHVLYSVGFYLLTIGLNSSRGGRERDVGQYDQVQEIPLAHVGISMVRRKMLEEIGSFDETFFMTREDDDLSLRAWVNGWRVIFVPKARVYHKSAATTGKFHPVVILYLSMRNRWMVILKNYGGKLLVTLGLVAILMVFLRGFFSRKKGQHFYAYFCSLFWVIKRLKFILRKRRLIQSSRRTKDGWLLKKGILRKPTINDLKRAY